MNKFKPTKIAKSLILLGFLPPPLLALESPEIYYNHTNDSYYLNAVSKDGFDSHHPENSSNLINTSTNSLLLGSDNTSTKGFTKEQLIRYGELYGNMGSSTLPIREINGANASLKKGKYFEDIEFYDYNSYFELDRIANKNNEITDKNYQKIVEFSHPASVIKKRATENLNYSSLDGKGIDLLERMSSRVGFSDSSGVWSDYNVNKKIFTPKLMTKVKINDTFKQHLEVGGSWAKDIQSMLENADRHFSFDLFKETIDYSQILPNLDNQPMNIDATKYEKMKVYYDNIDWDADQVLETSNLNAFKQKLKANIDIYEKIEQIKASQDEQEKTRLKEEVRALLQSPDNLFDTEFKYVVDKEKFMNEAESVSNAVNAIYNENYHIDRELMKEQLNKGLTSILGREVLENHLKRTQDDLARYKEEARKYITENIPEDLGRDELLEKLNRDELQESDFEALRTQIKERIVDKGDKHIVMGWNTIVDGDKLTAIGDHNQLKGEKQVVIGNDNVLEKGAINTFVLGSNVHANVANSVALGNETSLEEAVATPNHTIAGTAHNFAGSSPVGTVSIGADGKERTLTHLAAGRISDTSTDGINGSQLNAVIGEINKVAESLSRFSIVGGKNISVKKEGDTYTISSGVTSSTNAGATAEAVAKPTIVGDKNIETEVSENGHVALKLKDDLEVKTVHTNTIHSERVNTTQLNATEVNTKNMNAEKMTVEKLIVGGNELGTKGLTVGNININENGIDAGNKPINNVANGEISPNSKQAINGSQIFPIVNQLYQQSGQIQQLDNRVNNVEQRLIKQNKRLEARIAGVAALNGVPQATTPGKNMVGVGAASSGSGHAIAIGYSVLSDNSKHVVKTSFTIDSQKRAIGNIGYGFQW